MFLRPVLAAAGILLASPFSSGQVAAPVDPSGSVTHNAPKYMRVDDSSADRVKLRISSRTMVPVSGSGPAVDLVGVSHIGDAAYYEELQTFLDGFDLVLYEGVKPGGMGTAPGDADAGDASKVKVTKARLRMLATLIERNRTKGVAYPESLSTVIDTLDGTMKKMATAASTDAWGNTIIYTWSKVSTGDQRPARHTFDLLSLGADASKGGDGAAADLAFSMQKPLTKAEKQGGEGIQIKLANALGLQFQLSAINYTRDSWRNSDLAIDEVQQKLEESGAPGDAFFSLMDGSSFGSKLLGFLLGYVERDPQMAMLIKLMLVETVAHADALMEAQPGAMGRFMKVIVIDRNTAVLEDLRNVIDTEPDIKHIALFYGAGHLPDMETRLEKDFGYRFEKDAWFTAMDLDLASVPGGRKQADQMRRMIRQMIEKQKSQSREE
mgnify:CR=1 FL=1